MMQKEDNQKSTRPTLVRWWEPVEAEPGIAALRKLVMGPDHPHVGMDFLIWLSGPGNPAGVGGAVVVERAGKVIGIGAAAPRFARIDGRDVKVAFAYDLMIDKNHAGTNAGRYALRIARRWTDWSIEQGFAMGVTFPNDNWRPLVLSRHVAWQAVFYQFPRLDSSAPAGGVFTSPRC